MYYSEKYGSEASIESYDPRSAELSGSVLSSLEAISSALAYSSFSR